MDRRIVELDAGWIVPADLEAVDALARLQLAAVRRNVRLRLSRPSDELRELLQLVGLMDVLVADEDAEAEPQPGGNRVGGSVQGRPPGR